MLDLVLGTEKHRRQWMFGTLTAQGVCALCLLIQWVGVHIGWTSASSAAWLTVYLGLGMVGFSVCVRSGFSRRFSEPSLTMPQMVFAMVAIAQAYIINPRVSGSLLVFAALVLVFGAFRLKPLRCRQLGWIAVGLLSSAMLWGARTDPQQFDPWREVFHFLFGIVVLPTLSMLAGQLSQTRLDQARQKAELRLALELLQQHATHDELTGLPNRRHVQQWIVQEAARSHRTGSPLCVAIIDLDHFKRINDTCGHAVGDAVLRTFAHEARSVGRTGDVLARWGGEEFLLVMPNTSLVDARVALGRLREHMAANVVWSDSLTWKVTFSAGLTAMMSPQTLEDAVKRADAALYDAKRSGRDRVTTAGFGGTLDQVVSPAAETGAGRAAQ